MYALIENNAVTKVGELATLFPNTSNPTHAFAIEQGALEVVEGEQKDQRFYWVTFDKYEVTGNVVTRTYVNTPKALEDVTETPEGQTEPVTTKGLKSQWIAQNKESTNKLLMYTDWMVIRKAERNVDIPDATVTYRASVITECTRLVDAIAGANDVPALIAVVTAQNWPREA